jgi:hypothetical protein
MIRILNIPRSSVCALDALIVFCRLAWRLNGLPLVAAVVSIGTIDFRDKGDDVGRGASLSGVAPWAKSPEMWRESV